MPRTIRADAPKASDKAEQALGNREEWLTAAAQMIVDRFEGVFAEHFEDAVKQLSKVRASTGFPSRRGENGKVIGQCWNSKASRDESHHIFINPLLEDPVRVVATLAHELVHAADDGEHHHKGVFVRAVRGIGLEGKPTATFAGAAFEDWVNTEVLSKLGPYPHVALTPTVQVPKQKTYMLKVQCPYDGAIVRMTQTTIDNFNTPFCGSRSHMIDGQKTDKRVRMEVVS